MEVKKALRLASSFQKAPGYYRYHYNNTTISGYKYRHHGTYKLYSNRILYHVNQTTYGRDIVVDSIFPTTPWYQATKDDQSQKELKYLLIQECYQGLIDIQRKMADLLNMNTED